jgi:hypothetical protein
MQYTYITSIAYSVTVRVGLVGVWIVGTVVKVTTDPVVVCVVVRVERTLLRK